VFIYTTFFLFICWWTLRLFPVSWLLQIMLQWTLEYRYLFYTPFLFLWDTNPEVGLLDHMMVLFLMFLSYLHTVFHCGCTTLHSWIYCIPSLRQNSVVVICIMTWRDLRDSKTSYEGVIFVECVEGNVA